MVYEKPKIFIIDDNPELLKEILPEYGYEVQISESGKEAFEKLSFSKSLFDIILLDILLPEINGWDLLRYIRANDNYKHTPVIMMSALNNEVDLVSSLKIGADDYVIKPFNLSTLVARIEALLRRATWPKIDIMTNDSSNYISQNILTSREKEIMNLIAKGFANRQIAEELFVSELTVKTHLKNIFKKLNSTNRTQAILTAINKGIVEKR